MLYLNLAPNLLQLINSIAMYLRFARNTQQLGYKANLNAFSSQMHFL